MKQSAPLQLVRPCILRLAPYSTARDEYQGGDISVWLDANESPYDNGVNRYPDPHQRALKALLSEIKGVDADRLFVGNGSDEAIDLAFRIFCNPGVDNVVAITPSYGMYAVCAATNDVELREVPLKPDFSLPTEDLLAACDAHTKLMWVCSPNNPTGNAFPTEQLESLADRFEGILVVDEAYVDFSEKGSLLPVLDRHPNLLLLQTLSKAWGMAGLRLGLAFAHPDIARLFARVKYPYNVNGPTQQTVMQHLRRGVELQVAEIKRERQRLAAELPLLPVIHEVYPSDANFFLVRTAQADDLYEHLVSKGIIVRNRTRMPLCRNCLRLTIGTPQENDRLLDALRAASKNEKR